MQRLEGKYPAIEGLVYGSRARGDHKPDSDTDLAVILKGERGDRYKVSGDMAGIAFDVMMETGVLVSPLPLWEEEFRAARTIQQSRLDCATSSVRDCGYDDPRGHCRQLHVEGRPRVERGGFAFAAGKTEGACNRAYYAMHDAAHAALFATGFETPDAIIKAHHTLIAEFGKRLVLGGQIDAAHGRAFNKVQEMRLVSDYSAEPPPHDKAQEAVEKAEALVAAIRSLIAGLP